MARASSVATVVESISIAPQRGFVEPSDFGERSPLMAEVTDVREPLNSSDNEELSRRAEA
jgi:hypothetical protein